MYWSSLIPFAGTVVALVEPLTFPMREFPALQICSPLVRASRLACQAQNANSLRVFSPSDASLENDDTSLANQESVVSGDRQARLLSGRRYVSLFYPATRGL
jgi:hypothetical protein